jgi:aminoglycoside phosphotransferase (APT) family kinase protein
VIAVDGSPPVVVKRGPADQLAREAAALRRLAPLRLAPRLIAARPGAITMSLVPGAVRPLGRLRPADARALGVLLRRVHDSARTATGGLPGWPGRVRSLAAYRRRRTADMLAIAGGDRGLAERVIADAGPGPAEDAPRPFRFLHGDLAASNVLWSPAPALVDWEFWRMGDPAEDLAYLAEINDLPDRVFAAVVGGYGDPGIASRIRLWRPLCALDIALWYRDEGHGGRIARLERAFGAGTSSTHS